MAYGKNLGFAAIAVGLSAAASAAQQRTAESFQVTVIRDEATIRDFHSAIVAAGHDCADIKLAFTEIDMTEGKVSMVYCGIGRPNSTTQFPALLYRVIRTGGSLIVVPW